MQISRVMCWTIDMPEIAFADLVVLPYLAAESTIAQQ